MRRVCSSMVILIFVLSLVACGSGTGSQTDDGTYKVYLITWDKMDDFWIRMDAGCTKAIAEIGDERIEYIWEAADHGYDDQTKVLNHAVRNGAEVVLLAAASPDDPEKSLETAADHGVNFIFVDAPANWDGALQTIQTNQEAAGKLTGQTLLAALTESGVIEGDIGIVSVHPDIPSVTAREKGFQSAFEGTHFTFLETAFTDDNEANSKDAADSFIAQGVVGLLAQIKAARLASATRSKKRRVPALLASVFVLLPSTLRFPILLTRGSCSAPSFQIPSK